LEDNGLGLLLSPNKKIKKIFKKTIDKSKQMCYNKGTKTKGEYIKWQTLKDLIVKLGITTTSAINTTTQTQVLNTPLILRLKTKKPTDTISMRRWVALGLNKQPPFLLL
jgi:hypothetical protein